ncbi:MAG: CoA activase, partial [Deltaproteobacteria bacterium]
MNKEQFYVGIDVGSVSVNCVVIDKNEEIIYEAPYRRHFGRIEDVVSELVEEIYKRFGKGSIRAISFTGNHGRKLSKKLNTHYEFDTISQVLGALKVVPDVRTIISMGGQDTELFQINHTDSGWELEYFNTNGPCASGTGSFIDQQAQRLATSIYSEDVHISQEEIDKVLKDFIELGLKSDRPASVACRCTVFTKSDMIHLQNRGEKLEDIIYGLHVGNARNYISTIVGTRTLKEPIIFIGGLSLNKLQVKAFKEYFPNLIIPPFSTSIGAIGVALQVLRQDRTKEEQKSNIFDFDLDKLDSLKKEQMELIPTAPKLRLRLTHFPEADEIKFAPISNGEKVYLGIDIGSTSTKYALINTNKEIVHKCYVPTQGRPIEVTQHLLKVIKEEVGDKIEIAGVATTGSGRNVVGDFLNADLIIDEITAHARGAVEIDPEVDTIFEIGGQDSKYIYIQNRHPLDFDMNKVCAAGTGSFLHELANKYGINIVGEFQEIALSSDAPVRLTERCTVFMESDLVSYHQRGVDIKDLMAGLCYAIVYNYLNRVVGRRKIGKRIMFLGGPSLNKAVVAAFENVLGREILVPPHREVLGAYGAAISVLEKMEQEGKRKSDFRGLDSAINDRMEYVEKICTADPNCSNQCKLKIYNFGGRKSIWGGDCGRYETSRTRWKRTENYFAFRQKIWDSY